MKFGVVVFPGSNCDRDMIEALQNELNQEVQRQEKIKLLEKQESARSLIESCAQ